MVRALHRQREDQAASKLTASEERRCLEYVKNLNATRAYIRAGYSPTGADGEAARLLGNVRVQQHIEELKAPIVEKLKADAEDVVRRWLLAATSDPRKIVKWGGDGVRPLESDEMSLEDAQQVTEVGQTLTKDGGSIRVKMADRHAALESLAKCLGLYKGDTTAQQAPTATAEGFMKALMAMTPEERERLVNQPLTED